MHHQMGGYNLFRVNHICSTVNALSLLVWVMSDKPSSLIDKTYYSSWLEVTHNDPNYSIEHLN